MNGDLDELDDMYLEDDADILDIIEIGFPRKIYQRADYFNEMDNLTFFQRFRLRKQTVQNIVHEIQGTLEFPNNMNNCISPMNQVLTALRFYATNGHLSSVADFMGMHYSTASRIICNVSNSVARLAPQDIKMPEMNEIVHAQNEFYRIASFPRVIGCIDRTHIKIQPPGGEDGEVFRNRKGYFSLNTQVIGDSNLRINNIVARWPGSAHDQTIFINSRVRARFEAGEFPNSILLGDSDSGYALRPYLLTPVLRPQTRSEHVYNQRQIRTRNSIERLFGVWKRRFPVLAYGFRCRIDIAMTIIVATAVLHNIAITANDGDPPAVDNMNEEAFNHLVQLGDVPDILNDNVARGNNYREELIHQYFANL